VKESIPVDVTTISQDHNYYTHDYRAYDDIDAELPTKSSMLQNFFNYAYFNTHTNTLLCEVGIRHQLGNKLCFFNCA
jgi:hypothetical protein